MLAKDKKPQKKPAPVALLVACDVLLIGVALCVFALFHHVLPQAYVVVGPSTGARTASVASIAATPAVDPAPTLGQPIAAALIDGGGAQATVIAPQAPTATSTSAPTATATAASAGLGGAKFAARFTTGNVIATAATYQSGAWLPWRKRFHTLHQPACQP